MDIFLVPDGTDMTGEPHVVWGTHPMAMSTLLARITASPQHYFDGACHVLRCVENILFMDQSNAADLSLVEEDIAWLTQYSTQPQPRLLLSLRLRMHVANAVIGQDLRALCQQLNDRELVDGLVSLLAVLFLPRVHVERPRGDVVDFIRETEIQIARAFHRQLQSTAHGHDPIHTVPRIRDRGLAAREQLRYSVRCVPALTSTAVYKPCAYTLPDTAHIPSWTSGCETPFLPTSREEVWDKTGDPAGLVRLISIAAMHRLSFLHGMGVWDTVASGTSRLGWMIAHASPDELKALFINGHRSQKAVLHDGRLYCRHYRWTSPLDTAQRWLVCRMLPEDDDDLA